MPPQKRGVRMIASALGKSCSAIPKQNLPDSIHVIDVIGQEDRRVIRDGQQSSVEHPVDGARQSETILHYVRSSIRNRLDVGGFDLGNATPVDELKAGERAALAVG